jgi:hypothetical protein
LVGLAEVALGEFGQARANWRWTNLPESAFDQPA